MNLPRLLCWLGFHRFARVDPTTVRLLHGRLPAKRCVRCGARL